VRGLPDARPGGLPADGGAVEACARGRREEALGGLPQGVRPRRGRRGVRRWVSRRAADGDAASVRSGGDNGALRLCFFFFCFCDDVPSSFAFASFSFSFAPFPSFLFFFFRFFLIFLLFSHYRLGAVLLLVFDGGAGAGMRQTFKNENSPLFVTKMQGAGLAVLTCTYGFKLFEAAAVVLRKRGVKGEGGEGHHGGLVEKTPAALPSKGRASLEEDDKYGICAVASASELSPKKLCGDPGFGSRRGGGRGGDNKGRGGGKEEAEEEEEKKKRKDKSDSFDSAAGCCGRDNEP